MNIRGIGVPILFLIITFSVEEIRISEKSRLTNQSLKEAQIREVFGVSIVAIKRNGIVINNPSADEQIQANDIFIVFGSEKQLNTFETVV